MQENVWFQIRQLMLGDNMSLTLAFGRWRSSSFRVLVILRRIAAYTLAREVALFARWIPSELDSSDAPI